jgi:hypothetical protein
MFTVIDGVEMIEAQQLGQPTRVDLVILVALQRRLKKVGVLTSDTLAAKVGDEVMSARELLRTLTRRRSVRRNTDAANAD